MVPGSVQFHVKTDLWKRVGDYLGLVISPKQQELLEDYRHWLVAEALPAGGIGPGEGDRLQERHLADSLLFYSGWEHWQNPASIWDLGSGVGLPGIPLAILLPDCLLTLIDRAGRRVDLAKRAVRVLDLPNVEIRHNDLKQLSGETEMMVSRATTGLARLNMVVAAHLRSNGVAVVGGSWKRRPLPDLPGWELKEIPRDVLDRPVWLLIMRV